MIIAKGNLKIEIYGTVMILCLDTPNSNYWPYFILCILITIVNIDILGKNCKDTTGI